MTKRAFVTGIGGQDGWYLAKVLNEKMVRNDLVLAQREACNASCEQQER